MEMKVGATFELVWRNDELTDPPGSGRPDFFREHRMEGRITELDPPRKLAITWGNTAASRSNWSRVATTCCSP